MENTARQKPAVSHGTYKGMGLDPGKTLQMVAVDDIGALAALAFAGHGDVAGKTVELSGDELTEAQAAAALARVIGREVKLTSPDGARQQAEEMKAMHRFFSGKGYDADIAALRKLYPGLRTFEAWLRETGWENLPVLPMPSPGQWGR
jgi:nucleoside-diphosphate-sugar epimerase